jgi:hypothetical protein
MAAASFELPNGFVNHGAMACEALAMLDCAGDIDSWARRFAAAGGASADPVMAAGFEWRQALGDYRRLPEWIGYFTQAIDDDGWPAVVVTWVPRFREHAPRFVRSKEILFFPNERWFQQSRTPHVVARNVIFSTNQRPVLAETQPSDR